MIKLASLIREIEDEIVTPRAVPVASENLIQLLVTKYNESTKVYVENPTFGLYRGYEKRSLGGENKFPNLSYYINPKTRTRTAKEANNFYTEFISNSPNWQGYPRRDHAVIGATFSSVATDYGDLIYYVVPKNGAKFVVCSRRDCWNSFPHFSAAFERNSGGLNPMGVDYISTILAHYFSVAAEVVNIPELKGYYDEQVRKLMGSDAISFLDIIDSYWKEIVNRQPEIIKKIDGLAHTPEHKRKGMTNFAESLDKVKSTFSSFTEYFNDLFDPVKNKIELIEGISAFASSKYGRGEFHAVEFWTDAECILVPLTQRSIFSEVLGVKV